jgi:GTPase SAR1 family protein
MKQKDAFKILKQECNVLLTGAAGSGKTFLIEKFSGWAKGNNKRVAITATTGIAATNINGKTIHNYCNLGISNKTDLLDNENVLNLAIRMKSSYKSAIKNTDILIIDEISMLHDYQLNAADKIIRTVRNNNAPFGGLQVILCGDFFQLPPITQNNEQANFIIQAQSYVNGKFKVCYLEEFWRQNKDDNLIKILNAIRSNKLTSEYSILKNKCLNTKLPSEKITKLYCTNIDVDEENKHHLEKLSTKSVFYLWEESGQPRELNCKNKVAENLELKIGAIVMFVKNNLQRGYYNGSIGEVISFDDNNLPNIRLNDGHILKSIKQDDFYREDPVGNRLATIKQIPLKLAWAITIHKSQGMTLDKVSIDLGNTFTAGQGYVALSRARSIEHISLIGISQQALTISQQALNIENELQEESKETLKELINEKPDISKQILSSELITFITTQGINHFLYELIKNANNHVTLITPYAKLNIRLKELLKNKKEQGVAIIFVCRINSLNDNEKTILSECSTQIKNKDNLHAKCYISENEAIISSLNLYEYSQVNNEEMGILVKKNHTIYKDILEDAIRIINNSHSVIRQPPNQSLNNIKEIKIIKVTVVSGSNFPPNNWKRDMQKIETNKGDYIDNIPKYKGFDWKLKVGENITDFTINRSCGYNWLNKNY